MTTQADATRLLDAAEALFYERGYQAVGMDALRSASDLPLKRVYSLFSGKDAIAIAMLDRRDERWHNSLAESVARQPALQSRPLAIFDWLAVWLSTEGFRGCAWINAFGELGGVSPEITQAVRQHKTRLKAYVNDVVHDAGASQATADAIFILIEGCMVTAGISGDNSAISQARNAAARLLESS